MSEEIKYTQFPRGLKPTPRHKLAAAVPFQPTRAAIPTQVAYVPAKLSMWGNSQYGDCVSAEEAFNKAVSGIFVQEAEVISWARQNGYLNGADLGEVMDSMARRGFAQDSHVYGDGGYKSVDYSNESVLQTALAIAPVKIGIDANALPSGAGNANGWHSFGGRPGEYRNEDHCVALAGYGPASYLFGQLGVALPAGVDGAKPCYLLFTWSTIGVVDHDWIMSTVGEAWVRSPSTTIDGQAIPDPGPKPVPAPTVKVTVSPLTVNYGDSVRIDVVATDAASVVCDGQAMPADGGTISETATLTGDVTVTATAVGKDGSKVQGKAVYHVNSAPPQPTPNVTLPVWAWILIGVLASGLLVVIALLAVKK
jgi:hypothetical protein